MKRLNLLMLVILPVMLVPVSVLAQRGQYREKIRAQKVAFITERLQLTAAEAEKFWPLYNEMDEARKKEMESFGDTMKIPPEEIAEMPEDKANTLLDGIISHEQKMLDLQKGFYLKLKGIIPTWKILVLHDSEREFKKMLLEKIGGHGRPEGPGPGRGFGGEPAPDREW